MSVTVTSYTAEKVEELIAGLSIVSVAYVNGKFVLKRGDGTTLELDFPLPSPKFYTAQLTAASPTSGANLRVLGTISVPALPFKTRHEVCGHWTGNPDSTGAKAQWSFTIHDTNSAGSVRFGIDRQRYPAEGSGATRYHFSVPARQPRAVPANTPVSYVACIARTDGSGIMSNGASGWMSALVIPDL